jgi:pimeloyl-ACP methyl ester carboxylesterase
LSTAFFGVATAFLAAVSLAATALIVPGTGDPDANIVAGYRQNFVDRYSTPFYKEATAPFDPFCTSTNGCTLTGINYPASFSPLFFLPGWCEAPRCQTWNTSVRFGTNNLYDAVVDLNDPDGALLMGYSQGGAVVSNALRRLASDPALLDKIKGVVLIGNAYNPDGGLFTRLGFLPTIPILDITFGPATPVHLAEQIGPMTFIGFEYDPVMYAPLYWGNPFALINALAAFDNVHGYYLTPNQNGPTDAMAYGYTDAELKAILDGPCPGPNCRVDEYGNEYWMIPAKGLPIVNAVMALMPAPLQPFAQVVADLVSPALKVLIDLGYDWSSDPADTRFLSILPFNPFQNWIQVGIKLASAVVEGIQNAFARIQTMVAPTLAGGLSPFNARVAEVTDVDQDVPAGPGADVADVVDENSTIDATSGTTPPATEPTEDEPAADPIGDLVDTATAKWEEAKAEREAAREEAKAEREAKREAAKAERDAAIQAVKDKWDAAKATREGKGDDAGTDVEDDPTDASDTGDAAA